MEAKKKIQIFSIILFFVFSFTSNIFAKDIDGTLDQYDSMSRYNALENKISFISGVVPVEKSLVGGELKDAIMQKLEAIIEKQNFSSGKVSSSLLIIKNSNSFKNFLVGNNLGALKFEIVQTKDMINLLQVLSLQTENESEKLQINQQLNLIKAEQDKVESFILDQENGFSLFGWFTRIL
ncbi:MAG: hypothetical protein WCI76_02565 [bacterium]